MFDFLTQWSLLHVGPPVIADVGVDSSSRFLSRVRTNRHTKSHSQAQLITRATTGLTPTWVIIISALAINQSINF